MWDVVRGLPVCRLLEVPRPDEHDGRDEWRDQRLAALVSAYHAGGDPVLLGWRRAEAFGPTEVFVGGSGLLADRDGQDATLSLPAGGRGVMLPEGLAENAMAHWVSIGGIADGLLVDDPAPEEPARPSLEDGLLSVWMQPFAWMLVAEPVEPEEARRLADDLADRQQRAQSMAEMSPEESVTALRMDKRHRELRQAATTGLWRVHLTAGAATPRAAARVAALVSASADLSRLPYALVPGAAGPFEASTQLVAALARPPVREVAGVRFVMRPEFDVTPESAATGVRLGRVLDRNRRDVGEMSLPLSSLNRHTFVCGATGAGKSQTVRSLLTAASEAGLPWMVVEPAKAEYRLMAARLPDAEVVTIRPGDAEAVAAGINPLEPALGPDRRPFSLQTHADLVRALFLAAFEAEEPFPQVLAAALTRCYERLGWDLALGEPSLPGTSPRYPTLADLQATAEQVVDDIGYSQEITDNVRGFIRVRLSSLRLGTTGRFFEGGHPIDFDALLSRNVVLEIEDVGDDRDKAFLMGTVLVRLVEHLRLRQRRDASTGLRHLSVFEEAHRLLRRTEQAGAAAHAVETFASLLAEIRAYGEGLIVAEQIPSKLVPDVIKNTAVKIVHRLPAKDDRDAVGATMNITEAQSQFLVTLTPGEGAVFTDGMDFPHLVRMPDGSHLEKAVPTASPSVLVTPRSGTCGADCRDSPCTLRDMRAAQRAVADRPELVVWAELAAAAHLTGWGTPRPDPSLLDGLPARLRDCTVSHAVDAAVASRAAPTGLANHLVDVLHGNACSTDETSYFAAPYRWCLVVEELERASQETPGGGRHPSSGEWEDLYERAIPGDTLAEQLRTVNAWWERDQRDQDARNLALWGSGKTLETAVGALRTDPEWPDRFREATSALRNFGGLLGSYVTE
ncbi:DNA helicase HerA, contains HAS-barrel and ATPase domains [Actinomadura madurae]|uniref:DNA helicase HerA, contains HAS-barrel and ATPase domains n=1 Tax=Actinomadura madurae TaxID=1993 RepID=A0A1I4Z6D3_9ACTN|nr:ATP-binding protein [Actinomadura madurae]SFN45549.1 DNA helicase HerA, contains HAS-barrel and ATPase domains [Actinomadura madurae]